MTLYRIFFLNHLKSIIHAHTITAADDAKAVDDAHKVPRDAVSCDLWDAKRLVARFDGRNGGMIQPS
jgi:hypothetical protein